MSLRAAAAILLSGGAALAGCSLLAPFPSYPQPPAAGVSDRGPRVAICYDMVVTSRDTVQKAAQGECTPQTVATRVANDWKLEFCPILLPERATFVCSPKK
ncbi:MAG TPA: hypothetical protein VNV18_13680 [Stellaceae bacterium]|nr:hypothetical protein [Stellaceae bacterium]